MLKRVCLIVTVLSALWALPVGAKGGGAAARACAACPDMVNLPGGRFQMGSKDPESSDDERPVHTVTVSAFSMGRYEVTQRQWREVMGNDPSEFSRCGDDCPVENVSYDDVQAFIRKLNGLTGQRYRLPTEAEWEYAARAGTKTPFYTGRCITTQQANYDGNYDYAGCRKTGVYKRRPVAVGSYPPNPWGLYDMAGNVWEWTCSAYHDHYGNGAETRCAESADSRVIRGGSWLGLPSGLRSAYRAGNFPGNRFDYLGFRLAQDAD